MDCVRDYFYQSLMPHGFHSTSVCDKEQIDLTLKELKKRNLISQLRLSKSTIPYYHFRNWE